MATPFTAFFTSFFHFSRIHVTTPFPQNVPGVTSKIPETFDSSSGIAASQHDPVLQPFSRIETAVRNSGSQLSIQFPPVRSDTIRKRTVHFLTMFGAPLFVSLWGILSIFLVFRMAIVFLYFRQLYSRSEPVSSKHENLCRSVAEELGVHVPRIFRNPYITSTFIIGVLHPTIMIPYGDQENPMATREVFFHEIAHLIRHDHIWLYFGHLGIILLPLQPLSWILRREIEETNDLACDDFVLRHTKNHNFYAEQLFDLALSFQSCPVYPTSGVGIFSKKSHFRRRVEHIIDTSLARHITANSREVVSFVLIFCCTVIFTGLVGVRGKSLAQVRSIPEVISWKVSEVATSVAVTVKEQLNDVLQSDLVSVFEQDSNRLFPEPVIKPVEGEKFSELPKSSPKELPEQSMPDQVVNTTPVERDVEVVRSFDGSSAADEPVSEIIAETSPDEQFADIQTGSPAEDHDREREEAVIPMFTSEFAEFQVSGTNNREFVVTKPGPVEIDIPDGLPSDLRESLERGQENPVWSPSGKLIAFTGNAGNGIWTIPVQGGKPSLVYDNTDEDMPGNSVSPKMRSRALCFTPDGYGITVLRFNRQILPITTGKEAAVEQFTPQPLIENIDIRSGERQIIVENGSDGCWSPDGRYFVYVEGDYYGISVL
ncbi:MAG: PD40 domain-containing protein, partial [Candidatus Latescibacteria bacterium]|nr:PD40 domain-containing protein [Candidatus Latescibacterota bacterium]